MYVMTARCVRHNDRISGIVLCDVSVLPPPGVSVSHSVVLFSGVTIEEICVLDGAGDID